MQIRLSGLLKMSNIHKFELDIFNFSEIIMSFFIGINIYKVGCIILRYNDENNMCT